jgi:DNA-binding MarR family transcriptional regulator
MVHIGDRSGVSGVVHDGGGRGPVLEGPALLERELGFRMGQTHRVLKETWERQIVNLGLSAPLAATLRAICEQPGSGLRELARRMRTDPMNAKRLVDQLEHEGLVTSRDTASHARRRAIDPTTDGLARAARLVERSTDFRRHLAELIGTSELNELQHLLVRLEDALGGARPGTPGPVHEGAQG